VITTTTSPKYNFDYGKIIYSYKLFHLNDMQVSILFLLEVLIKFNGVGSNPVEGRTKKHVLRPFLDLPYEKG
jgi:hypothetical protein